MCIRCHYIFKLIVSEGDCVESDSDTDDDCEEFYRHCAISL